MAEIIGKESIGPITGYGDGGCGGRGPGPRPLYASPIHQGILGGDLGVMKGLAQEAEEYLRQHGNVSAALDTLHLEIARLEAKEKQ